MRLYDRLRLGNVHLNRSKIIAIKLSSTLILMILKFKKYGLLVGLLFGAVGIVTAQTSNSVVTFSVDMSTNIALGTFNPGSDKVSVLGTFNGWSAPGVILVQEGASTVYTNTVTDTDDPNGGRMQYKFYDTQTTYESPADNGNNRLAVLPATSGGSLVLGTPFFADDGAPVTNYASFAVDMSQQIALSNFVSGDTVSVNGLFNGWGSTLDSLTNDLSISVTNGSVVETNVWDGTFQVIASPWSMSDYKFVIQPAGNYEGVPATDLNANPNSSPSPNRYFTFNPTITNAPSRVFFADAPYAPLCKITLSVDMSVQLAVGNWNPSDGIFCAGMNSDWNNDTVNTMTNNPADPNTNDYYATFTVGQEASQQYKFTYNGLTGTVYENPSPANQYAGGNRGFLIPLGLTSTNLPTVFFSDEAFANDFLTSTQMVTFTVNMTNAVQYGTDTPFNPSSDTVYVNGAWLGWLPWNPVNLIDYELTNNPPGSEVYSGVFPIPNGNPIGIVYKYGIDGSDNEAGENANHERYVRTTATGSYSFSMDTFGNQYNEPAFGQLAVGPASAGAVPLSWLGAPNVQIQTTTNLTNSVWVTYPQTSGTNWTAGTYGTNGLVSATNWPTAGSQTLFYRLLEQ